MCFKNNQIAVLLVIFMVLGGSVLAQEREACFGSKVLGLTQLYPITPLAQVHAQDVMWHRRLWREIDLTEKVNHQLYFSTDKQAPKCCLFDLFKAHILSGVIKAYDASGDQFTKELTTIEIVKLLEDSVVDASGQLIFRKVESKDVVKFWLKEDWFFDSKYSRVKVRIVGICPVKIELDQYGNFIGYKQLFWMYFPNIRGVLTNHEVVQKEAENKIRISFDDLFVQRMFNSYIIQKEGGQRQHVHQHKTELDIRLENEKTKSYSFKRETGLWGD